MAQRKRILFFAEAVTLAHVTRPLVLAQSLDSTQYEVHFACAKGFDFVFPKNSNITRWYIHSIPSKTFIKALASGARFYNKKTLTNYINEDTSLIHQIKPDIVIGDFRLSLAISAPTCKTPYIALTNAHWSPYSNNGFPLPDHPLTKFLGYSITNFFFQLIRPLIFTYHALPHNQLRKQYNLKPLGNLQQTYTHGDYTFYLDVPELIPLQSLPNNHYFIGSALWSPDIAIPHWFSSLNKNKKNIYVTLGSSGATDNLPKIISVLSKFDANILVATAGRLDITASTNVYVENFLPGIEIIRKCDLVVCNGGSATAYQALSEGTPVLGIACNMDQYLTMSYIEKSNTGILIRSEHAQNKRLLEKAINELLNNPKYKKNTSAMKIFFQKNNSSTNFKIFLNKILT